MMTRNEDVGIKDCNTLISKGLVIHSLHSTHPTIEFCEKYNNYRCMISHFLKQCSATRRYLKVLYTEEVFILE